ncbi:LruC domain-containing protein [uncultured Ferrimonas sp.]|uniref:LruC domain-containing protein n=1 Tax=uncultured Ferrimonas sp. TaxID=432640 RepID=UPI0026253794|nr:LruC domain-containing protein [uncultured Ferrimonas sp.]
MKSSLLLLALLGGANVVAAPFTNCPSEAYLYQGKTVVYGVDLVTGAYQVLSSDIGIANNVNAVGFNEADRYLYGFSKEYFDVVRMGSDYQAERLNISGMPNKVHFYVGDVKDNRYWTYHKSHGLYSINLDSSAADFAVANKVVGADTSMVLTDFAFHPSNGNLYAVDNSSGDLYQIDTNNGSKTVLGNTGVTGTFGAGFFEKSGYYYISRNSDGNIYRIDLRNPDQLDPVAEFFADGPSSSSNDGARCASAPVVAENVDFGDAPGSYGTRMEENGARHSLAPQGPMLGALVDAESDGAVAPWRDDNRGEDDEDGIAFINGLSVGQTALIEVQITRQDGYLQAFFDWNNDGDFDDAGEQVFSNQWLTQGCHQLAFSVPTDAQGGAVQSRFRISTVTDLRARGGAPDGEVEDHIEALLRPGVTQTQYPNGGGYATIAFEDRWPRMPDYDMNDVVVDMSFTTTMSSGKVTKLQVNGQLRAAGASYHNGLALHLPGISASNIGGSSSLVKSGQTIALAGLEAGQSDAVFVFSEDLKEEFSKTCLYYRTIKACDDGIQMAFELTIDFVEGIDPGNMPAAPFDPFIFATPGKERGGFDHIPGRDLEIHMADYPPTPLASDRYFGMEQDSSNPASGRYYRNSNNLPWALEFNHRWDYPAEQEDLLQAYPQLEQYLLYDGGQYQDWHQRPNAQTQHLFE